jgi:hypothetical protein
VTFANVKVFSQTRLAYDNSVVDQNSGVEVRAHHFVRFVLNREVRKGAPLRLPSAFTSTAKLRRIATGFSNASGLTAGDSGTIYFTDSAMHAVYKYAGSGPSQLLAKTNNMPQLAAYAGPSSLLTVNWDRSIASINPETGQITPVEPAGVREPGTILLLPVGLHNEEIQLEWLLEGVGYRYRLGSNTAVRSGLVAQPRHFYYAPGTKTAIMAGDTQKAYAAWVWRPIPESCQLAPFAVGTERYLTSEDDEKTYRATLAAANKLTASLAIERGGTSVLTDAAGNVYIAGAEVYVYDRNGQQTGILEIPERPSSLAFGNDNLRTLFIGARSSVYAIDMASEGQKQ